MHDFLSYLFHLFARSMSFAVPAVLFCAAGIAAARYGCKKSGRPFSWVRAVALLLLALWAAVTFYATILRSEPAVRTWNFSLFLAWREAYRNFTLQLWLNVLLNIALFVPLGILLPLLHRLFRRWYAAFAAGLSLSLAIELTQLFSARGMFDVDDLFTNTLGALVGRSLTMLVLTLRARERAWKRYCAVPLALVLTLAAINIRYCAQPYGNLRDAALERADLSNVAWSLSCALSDKTQTALVYRAETYSQTDAEVFAEGFAENLSIAFPDAYYYDDTVIFANHSTGDFLNFTLHDGTWEYSIGDDTAPSFSCTAKEVSVESLRTVLEECGLFLPEGADFSQEESGSFLYASFTSDLSPMGDALLHGTITCTLHDTSGGCSLTRIENGTAALTPVQEEAILTPAQALAALQSGKSFEGMVLERLGAEKITVLSCTLDYLSDTKGFYQPVYRFTLSVAQEIFTDYVPALK